MKVRFIFLSLYMIYNLKRIHSLRIQNFVFWKNLCVIFIHLRNQPGKILGTVIDQTQSTISHSNKRRVTAIWVNYKVLLDIEYVAVNELVSPCNVKHVIFSYSHNKTKQSQKLYLTNNKQDLSRTQKSKTREGEKLWKKKSVKEKKGKKADE